MFFTIFLLFSIYLLVIACAIVLVIIFTMPTKKYLKQNAKLLNINTILSTNTNANIGKNINQHLSNYSNAYVNPNANADSNADSNANAAEVQDLQSMNTIINNNISPKYKVVRNLGRGIQGNLYLALDKDNNKFIMKQIMLPTRPINTHTQTLPQTLTLTSTSKPTSTPNNISISNNRNKKTENNSEQLHFELNILKYLSNNSTTREHINPCLEYKVLDNNVYTIFPIFNGYSLSHMQNYLSRLNHTEYYKLVFHLIKTILHGMAKIHKTHISHQNVTENSILVSSYTKPKELTVKFTDFGLGCGHISNSTSNIIGNVMDIDDYQNDKYFNIATCKTNGNVPIIISDNVMAQLSESEYLQMSQKYDLLCLGMIFLKLLLFFDNLDIDLSKGYDKLFINNVKRYIIDKYMSKMQGKGVQTNRRLRQQKTGEHSNIFPLLNISTEMENDLLEYLKLLLTYVLCKTNNRKTCQYVLDKMIIYEKYKNDF